MIRSIVEAILGDFGRQLLFFYEANATLINTVVILYGLFMFLTWNNLVRVYRFLIIEVAKTVHLSEELNRKSTNKRIRDTIEIPWEKAVEAAPFPLVARLGALWPKRMSAEVLQTYFEDKEIVNQARKLLKGEHIKRMTPSSRRLSDRERAKKAGTLAPSEPVTLLDEPEPEQEQAE